MDIVKFVGSKGPRDCQFYIQTELKTGDVAGQGSVGWMLMEQDAAMAGFGGDPKCQMEAAMETPMAMELTLETSKVIHV